MKKLKLMILSFIAIAFIGGALAFKAKFGLQYYCATTKGGNTHACVLTNARPTNLSPSFSSKITPAADIEGVSTCSTFDELGNKIPITCSTPQWVTTRE